MKKITLLLGISLFCLNSSVLSKCNEDCYVYVGDQYYWPNTGNYSFTLDTIINSDRIISIPVRYYYFETGSDCWVNVASYAWYKNGNFISNSSTYTVTDTGYYVGVFPILDSSLNSCNCIIDTYYVYLRISEFVTTSVGQINTSPTFFITPSLSSGTYSIKSQTPLTQIQITDAAGKTVFASSQNISSLDLSALRSGIYFYYVEDKSLRVYRGKLIKD